MKEKKYPMRKCTGCGEMKDKRELIRVVKAPLPQDAPEDAQPQILLDLTGKAAGRGAYICRSAECFEKARKARRLERSLSCKIPEAVYERLRSELEKPEED
ncbi:MAG: YlxR family protein [Ruminococcus sp.]|nr:YlxR family protein [Ruminococcus sp.]